ncbi:uncharacterized protein LOC121799030 [Salvia splendens]|uniref:uncharacterized protein LOC121792006 n=1 Tax=Salvia splendens TaxID=180675 RepID=UPI001C273D37|nr:uncharacterized protein LOC121792006 [Salvia splendens]XP_042054282.1 uncharacterized protein LOC121799030 [Salvia splendens]
MAAPRFDGSDATNWVSRVQYYFNHLMMPDAQRLHYAEFLEDIRHRFGLIAKLTQTGSVVEYHDTFEKYLNRVQGIPERQLFTLFVAGLKPDMQERLRLHRPSSLAAAMALTLELADSHGDRQQHQQNSRRPWQARETRIQAGPVSSHPPTQNILGQTQQPAQGRVATPSRQPQVRVSQAEKAERAKMGLCYYCPDKWVIGHVCKQRLLCYADDSDDVDDGDLEKDMTEDLADMEVAHVHAMYGGRRSRPLKVIGSIQDREVCILIDTGSDRES